VETFFTELGVVPHKAHVFQSSVVLEENEKEGLQELVGLDLTLEKL
jgi:hypothetical protein